jgi:hypothetical protein
MTSWPDHLPSGNQKRFYHSLNRRVLVRLDHIAGFIVNPNHKLSEKPKSHLAATAMGCDGPRGVDSVCSGFNRAMNRGDGPLGPASRQSIELFH